MAGLVATKAPVNCRVGVVIAYSQAADCADFILQRSSLNIGSAVDDFSLLFVVILIIEAHQWVRMPFYCCRAARAKWLSRCFACVVFKAYPAEIAVAQTKYRIVQRL